MTSLDLGQVTHTHTDRHRHINTHTPFTDGICIKGAETSFQRPLSLPLVDLSRLQNQHVHNRESEDIMLCVLPGSNPHVCFTLFNLLFSYYPHLSPPSVSEQEFSLAADGS